MIACFGSTVESALNFREELDNSFLSSLPNGSGVGWGGPALIWWASCMGDGAGVHVKGGKGGASVFPESRTPTTCMTHPLVNNRLRKEPGVGHFPLQGHHYVKGTRASEH